MGRAPCCDKDAVKRGAWSPEEDKILADYISKHGHGTWRSLPKLAGLLRCGKSCRLRWTNYLRPDIKRGPFTSEEQNRIIQLHGMLGNKWAAIASHLAGRTDNEVKNFWNSQLKKRFFCKGHYLQASRPPSCSISINTKPESPSTRHMVQWESARVEAEARLSMNSFLNPSSSTPKTDCDYFLRLWNSEVGESFRKVNEQDGRESLSTTSHTSSLTKVGSGSGVTMQAGPSWTSSTTEQKFMEYDSSRKDANDMMVGSDSSDSYELDDPSDRALKQLLDFPSDDDMGFIQGQTDDVSIFFRH